MNDRHELPNTGIRNTGCPITIRDQVSFMDYDLGYFDPETSVLEPLGNPFGPKSLLGSRYVV
jgi:hypothetical protein